MLNRLLDALASRVGLVIAVAVVLCAAAAAMVYFDVSSRNLETNQRRFEESRLRNGFVAMSDIQRATLILQMAMVEGEMSEARRADFAKALDIIYVRADSFADTLRKDTESYARALKVIDALFRLVDRGDSVLETVAPVRLPANWKAFLEESETARRTIVSYLDEYRRVERTVVEYQSKSLLEQKVVLRSTLFVLTLTIVAALVLLRREVRSRKARDAAEARVNFLAFFDALTGLPNRVQFQDRVAEALDRGNPVALVLVDLDEFKMINDTCGHAVGDAVLVRAAGLLSDAAEREGGLAARLGGDEFGIFLPTDEMPRLAAFCERLLTRFAPPFDCGAERVSVGVSLGVASSLHIAAGMDHDYTSLARVADFALYASKLAGRGRATVYDDALERKFIERRAMQEELPLAVSNAALEVFLQPKLALAAGRITCFEALVRWRRHGQIVAPGAFIQVAEDSGLIADIDLFVLDEATRLVADWNDANGTGYGVSVNLSALHFNGDKLVPRVREALDISGLSPRLLTLEITESVQIHDWESVGRILGELRAIGCRISIDDFGTGYSSLAHVRAMAADELKIDRSLLQEIEESDATRFVLDAIVDLAGAFGMEIVAEGVETPRQAQIVRLAGVDYIQGYLLNAPLPAAEAMAEAARPRLTGIEASGVNPTGDPAAKPPVSVAR